MTNKQAELINRFKSVLGEKFNYVDIGEKSTYTVKEASRLIDWNWDSVYGNDGRCRPEQYDKLVKIAKDKKGRDIKLKRHEITYLQACKWIKEYE